MTAMISYDSSSLNTFAEIRNAFSTISVQFLRNESYATCHFIDEITSRILFFAWSETNVPAYRAACDDVFNKNMSASISRNYASNSNTPTFDTSDFPGVLLAMRNAVNFDYADARFSWIGYMSTPTTSSTNWGKSYFDDFEWIMNRQREFGLQDPNNAARLFISSAWPGFNDANVPSYWNNGQARYIARHVDDGNTLNLSFSAAAAMSDRYPRIFTQEQVSGDLYNSGLVNFDIPMIVVNTFNDFPEGTHIEASQTDDGVYNYGMSALEVTQSQAAAFKHLNDLPNSASVLPTHDDLWLPYSLFQLRKQRNHIGDPVLDMLLTQQYQGAAHCIAYNNQTIVQTQGWNLSSCNTSASTCQLDVSVV
jgi:hypothetical protein